MNFLTAGEVYEFIKNDDNIILSRFLADWINRCIAGIAEINDYAGTIKSHALNKELLSDDEFDHDDYFKGCSVKVDTFSLHLIWGENQDFHKSYIFKSIEERTAFLYGVKEAQGYFDYEYFFSKTLFNERIEEIQNDSSNPLFIIDLNKTKEK